MVLLAWAVLLSTSGSAWAAKGFGFVEGVAGIDPNDRTHEEWIRVKSFSQPVAGDKTLTGTGPLLGDFSMTKQQDASSQYLAQYAINGNFIPKVKIEVVVGDNAANNGRIPYLQWEMENARVSSYTPSGDAGGESVPIEEVVFNYDNIKYQYSEEDDTGKQLGKVTMTWTEPTLPPVVTTDGEVRSFVLVNVFVVPEPSCASLLFCGGLLMFRRPRLAPLG